jgi:hypothetical protein
MRGREASRQISQLTAAPLHANLSERKPMITQELLHSMFSYDPITGSLLFKTHLAGTRKRQVAGYGQNKGYLSVSIQNKKYLLHRLVWMFHHGSFPKNS